MPTDPEPHYQLGLAYWNSGSLQYGVNELVKAAELDPKHVAAQLKLAEIFTGNKNPDVIQSFSKFTVWLTPREEPLYQNSPFACSDLCPSLGSHLFRCEKSLPVSSQKAALGGQIRRSGHLRQACCGVLSRPIGAEVAQCSVKHFGVPVI
jgi:hypothetical protein